MSTPSRRDLKDLMEHEEREHAHPRLRWVRLATLVGPFAAVAAALAVIGMTSGAGTVGEVLTAAVGIFFVAGKFAPLFGLSGVSLGPWELATLVACMDVFFATILVFNLPVVYRLPRVGPILHDLADHGHYMLEKKPWLGRVTFLGVSLFVMFPLTGTGAVGGSIFGRLLGLSALRTWLAILIGAVVGSYAFAGFAGVLTAVFTEEVRASWQFRYGGAAIVLALIAIVFWRGKKVAQEIRARKALERGARGE